MKLWIILIHIHTCMCVCMHVCVCNSFPFYGSPYGKKEKDSKGTKIEAMDRVVGPNPSKNESNFPGMFLPLGRTKSCIFYFLPSWKDFRTQTYELCAWHLYYFQPNWHWKFQVKSIRKQMSQFHVQWHNSPRTEIKWHPYTRLTFPYDQNSFCLLHIFAWRHRRFLSHSLLEPLLVGKGKLPEIIKLVQILFTLAQLPFFLLGVIFDNPATKQGY